MHRRQRIEGDFRCDVRGRTDYATPLLRPASRVHRAATCTLPTTPTGIRQEENNSLGNNSGQKPMIKRSQPGSISRLGLVGRRFCRRRRCFFSLSTSFAAAACSFNAFMSRFESHQQRKGTQKNPNKGTGKGRRKKTRSARRTTKATNPRSRD